MRIMFIILAVLLIALAAAFIQTRHAMTMLTGKLVHNASNPHGKEHAYERFGVPGIVVANDLLDAYGLAEYTIVPINSMTKNRCNYKNSTIELSRHIYDGSTNISASVAAHEAAHAKLDKDNPWMASLITRLVLLRKALEIEMVSFIILNLIIYGFGASDTVFSYLPWIGATAFLLDNIVLGVLTIIDEAKASYTALSFISRQYSACGRKAARCASFLKDALSSYCWTEITWVLLSCTILCLFSIL